ncbi:hypothetical protein [Nocardioides bruguierae]|uniref:Uncharacterized protein n=1 Tax=Nocardioides bruguierae TaxID=2945102 RepID=A0A9X2IGL1_9ACTN|nr:hypothetical protein [Nocardioides bruguierae]MCM0622133.1 hypothetical protein [Nocardioides bruguierae]
MRSLGSIITAALLATAVLTGPTASAAEAEPRADPAARGKACNVNTYVYRVRNVTGKESVVLTRLREKSYPGRKVVKRGTTYRSQNNKRVSAGIKARYKAEVEAAVVLRKLVKGAAGIGTQVDWKMRVANNRTESVKITVKKRTVIPKATSVAWYNGRLVARGTGEYSWCDAIEGSGEGFVKWSSVRWRTFGPKGSGGARCDLEPQSKFSEAAHAAVCV